MENDKKPLEVSRRSFLKAAATGAGVVAAAGVFGITPALGNVKYEEAVKNAKTYKENVSTDAEPLPAFSAPAKWDYETDILIAGGGGAGLAAAVSALEEGAKVILVEKSAYCGGDTAIAMVLSGNMGSNMQKSLGIEPTPMPQRIFNEVNSALLPNCQFARNAAQCNQIMSYQAETCNWLEEHGIVFSREAVGGMPPGMGHFPIDPEHPEEDWYRWWPHNGRGFTEGLRSEAEKMGGTILTQHPAFGIVQDGNDRVIGLVCRDNLNKRDVYIKAGAVILCTGGFAANTAMLEKYIPEEQLKGVRAWGIPAATGDGIRMAMSLGADLRGMGELEVWDGGARRDLGAHAVYTTANQLVRQKSLTVNKKGQRFFCESKYAGYFYSYQANQTIKQLDSTSFTLFDADCISKDALINRFHATLCEYPVPWFDEQFEGFVEDGTIMKADSIKELAKLMEVDADALQATLDRYNELCDAGVDSDFFKESQYMIPLKRAPFYAVKQIGGSAFNTWGGLVVDQSFHVLDKNWDPIPGLYVAGENAAGLASVAFAIPGGRLAAQYAVKEFNM